MNKIILVIISSTLTLLLLSSAAQAQQSICRNCRIVSVQPDARMPGTIIYLSGSDWTYNANCDETRISQRFFVSASSPMAKEIVATALIAVSSGLSVQIEGMATCPFYAIEDVAFIRINSN